MAPRKDPIEAKRVRIGRSWLPQYLGRLGFGLALAPLIIIVVAGALLGFSRPPWWDGFMGVVWGGAIVSAIGAVVTRALEARTTPTSP